MPDLGGPQPVFWAAANGTVYLRTRDGATLGLGSGMWPAPRPSGREIALPDLIRTPEPRGVVRLVTPGDTGEPLLLYSSPPGVPPVIAPRVPQYIAWAPDGRHLAVVAPGADGLTLSISTADGAFSGLPLATGAPLFIAWNPAGTHLAVHSGQDLWLVDVEGHDRVDISARAAAFRTPVLTDRGVVHAEVEESEVVLVIHDIATHQRREISRFAGGLALAQLPNPDTIGVSMTRDPDSGVFDGSWVVDLESGKRRRVAPGPHSGAFWAPTGDRVATIVPTHAGDGRYQIQVYDFDGRFSGATEAFFPGPDFRTMVAFFDQYAISHPIWSADGTRLVVCGRLAGDGVAPSWDGHLHSSVFEWEAARAQPLRLVGQGEHATYPPASWVPL